MFYKLQQLPWYKLASARKWVKDIYTMYVHVRVEHKLSIAHSYISVVNVKRQTGENEPFIGYVVKNNISKEMIDCMSGDLVET